MKHLSSRLTATERQQFFSRFRNRSRDELLTLLLKLKNSGSRDKADIIDTILILKASTPGELKKCIRQYKRNEQWLELELAENLLEQAALAKRVARQRKNGDIPDGHDERPKRHWFNGRDADLFFWETASGEVVCFHLCYDRGTEERVFIWDAEAGCSHCRVDDGENRPGRSKGSPIFMPGGELDPERIQQALNAIGQRIPPNHLTFILQKVQEYTGTDGNNRGGAERIDAPRTGSPDYRKESDG